MTTYAEERVLKPLDPVPIDVNEWPDFALREVKIFYQGKGRYADLLEASPEVPLCVVGELMPLDDEQEHLALMENHDYVRVKIDNVSNYSFGQDDSGTPVIWAAGKAGWYELTPSDRYSQHYNDTIEAIDLFYFMVDQYQKLSPKRRRLGFLIDPFLTAYQKHTDFRIDDDDEAMETIHKHHKFLLKQMIEEREDIDWSQTHLWKHLAETYTDEVVALRATLDVIPMEEDIIKSSPQRPPDKAPITNGVESVLSESDSETEESESSGESKKSNEPEDTKIADARSEAETDSESDAKSKSASESGSESESGSGSGPESSSDSESQSQSESESEEDEDEEDEDQDQTDWTRPIFDLLNVLRKTSTFDIRNCGIEQLATEVVKLPAYQGNHKRAIATIQRFAEPLLRLMNEAKLRKKFNWSTRAIYTELEATLADEIAEEIRTPAVKRGKDKHRMKSVLRPSGATKSRKRTRGTQDDEDEDMIDEPPPTLSSPVMRRAPHPRHLGKSAREQSPDTVGSRDDSPSRQLNGHFDSSQLVELPPGAEAQEMLDLVAQEGRRVGRQNQTGHLQAFLAGWEWSI